MALIHEQSKQELVDAALKVADFIHKNRIKSVFCIEASARLPGRLVLEVYSRRFPRDVPPKVFFVAPASLATERYAPSVTPEAYEKALSEQSTKSRHGPGVFLLAKPVMLNAIKGRTPIMILDDSTAIGATMQDQHLLFSRIRGTDENIFLGTLHSYRLGSKDLKRRFGNRLVIGKYGGSPLYDRREWSGFYRCPGRVFSQPVASWNDESRVRQEISEFVKNANIQQSLASRIRERMRQAFSRSR